MKASHWDDSFDAKWPTAGQENWGNCWVSFNNFHFISWPRTLTIQTENETSSIYKGEPTLTWCKQVLS